MKKVLLLAFIAIATFAHAQITKVHSYDEHVYYQAAWGTEMLYSYQSNEKSVTLYNTDFSLYKKVSLQLPDGYGVNTVQYVTRGILTADPEYAFIVTSLNSSAPNDKKVNIAAYNEEGVMVYDFGYGQTSFGTVINEFNNHYYVFIHFAVLNVEISAYEVKTDIYQLYGTPTTGVIHKVSQITALPYPNPSSGTINLPYKLTEQVGSMYIYDVNGKQIDRRHITDQQDNLQLNISHYPAGHYFYVVDGQAQSFIVK